MSLQLHAHLGVQDITASCRQLLTAATHARDSSLDPWQLAVELQALHSAGLTNTDVRVLIAQGFLEHRQETTGLADRKRRFRPIRSLALVERTCLILTDAGRNALENAFAGDILPPHRTNESSESPEKAETTEKTSCDDVTSGGPRLSPPHLQTHVAPNHSHRDAIAPQWNARRHELCYDSVVVKHFRRPAPSLETILNAFEEDGWPSVIHDPLPCGYGENPKRRLHHTVRNLNTMQSPHLVHFYVNGHGEEIHWQPAARLPSKPRAMSAPKARKRR